MGLWDFGDFESIKSELRVPKFNEPVDYAFFSSKKKTDTPILLLEAKRLGSDLAHKNHVKQLTAYLGARRGSNGACSLTATGTSSTTPAASSILRPKPFTPTRRSRTAC